jgi:hypothetical protein
METVQTKAIPKKGKEPMSSHERAMLKTAMENYSDMKRHQPAKFKITRDELIRAIVNLDAPNWGGITVKI